MSENEPPQQTTTAPESRRRRRWPWVVLVLLVALVGGLRLALPSLVERGAAWGSRQYLGLPVRIDNVELDLIAGRVVVEGLSVAARPDEVAPLSAAFDPPPIDPDAALLHVGRVATRLAWPDLLDRTARLSEFVIEAPSVRVEQEPDGKIDPLRHARPVVPPAEPDAEPAPPEEPGEPWQIVVESFALNGPRLRMLLPDSAQELLTFSLERLGVRNVAAQGSDFSFEALAIEKPLLNFKPDQKLLSFSLDSLGLSAVSARDEAFALGTIEITNPLLEVRRALLFAESPAGEAEPAAVGPAPPSEEGTAAADVAEETPPTATPTARIEKIDVDGASFTWITDDGPLDAKLTLDASDVALEEGHRFPLELELETAEGTLALGGQVGLVPPAYSGTIRWSELRFPLLLQAALPDLPRWLERMRLNGELKVDADLGSASGPPAVRASGRLELTDVALDSPESEEVSVAWERLGIEVREVVAPLPQEGKPPATVRVRLGAVELVAPKILYTQPSPQLDALLAGGSASDAPDTPPAASSEAAAEAEVVATAPAAESSAQRADAAAAAPAAASSTPAPDGEGEASADEVVVVGGSAAPDAGAAPPAPVDLEIASIAISDGDLTFLDRKLEPPARTRLRELAFQVRDVRFPALQALGVELATLLPDKGRLTVTGDLRSRDDGDFEVALEKLYLPVFGSYAAAAGATLEDGEATLETRVRIRRGVVELDNDLLLDEFDVSLSDPAAFESEFGMPVDLALALLRDPFGRITLTIPVKVDERGTGVGLGTIMRTALRQALVGALAAPLKLVGFGVSNVGGLVGIGGKDGFSMKPLRVPAGALDPTDASRKRLGGFVKLLEERPGVAIRLRGRAGPADAPAIASGAIVPGADPAPGAAVAAGQEGKGFFGRIVDRIRPDRLFGSGDDPAPSQVAADERALEASLGDGADVPADQLDALATGRAERVRALLLEAGADPERVVVGDPAEAGKPGVVISLGAS